jgi:hypothetical protein
MVLQAELHFAFCLRGFAIVCLSDFTTSCKSNEFIAWGNADEKNHIQVNKLVNDK